MQSAASGRGGGAACGKMGPMSGYDVIVIGAGLGGLMTAARLAAAGRRILVLEAKLLPGGTSFIFRRGGYAFPMGPLSFGFPGRVREFLRRAGIAEGPVFRRSGFELRTPELGVMMSQPLDALRADLDRAFPEERDGLLAFFRRLESAIAVSKDMDLWHPDYSPSVPRPRAADRAPREDAHRVAEVRRLSRLPAVRVLDALIRSLPLRNFLGSLGTERPEMSMLNLASMWNVMAVEGIWSPVGGVHTVAEALVRRLKEFGVEVRFAAPVRSILVRDGRAAGVVTGPGEALDSDWVVSNADAKATLLELLDERSVPGLDLSAVRNVGYSGSELCVYLGLRPDGVDLSAIRAEHLIFRHEVREGLSADPEDFDNREFEICLWSRKAPGLVPPGRAAVLLRVGFPYENFARWRSGYRQRTAGYLEHKKGLAARLIGTAERILPGLSGAVEVMEVATPLTYRDWGNRFEGSIAGWTWSGEDAARLSGKLLVRTPVPRLLSVGAYAASELFLGGVPTALYTGNLAADIILSA